MLNLYAKPRTDKCFQEYFRLLQGDTNGDLVLPISGYNPMAKEEFDFEIERVTNLEDRANYGGDFIEN